MLVRPRVILGDQENILRVRERFLLSQHNLIWENFKIKAALLMRVFWVCSLVYLAFTIIRENMLVFKI